MKRLLSLLTPKNIIFSLVWSAASWSIQLYLGIPIWYGLLANLFFCASLCLKYPAQAAQKNLTLQRDWALILASATSLFIAMRWVKQALNMPSWGYYVALFLSIIVLERLIIEGKKLLARTP
jgi:hypothetical protein